MTRTRLPDRRTTPVRKPMRERQAARSLGSHLCDLKSVGSGVMQPVAVSHCLTNPLPAPAATGLCHLATDVAGCNPRKLSHAHGVPPGAGTLLLRPSPARVAH